VTCYAQAELKQEQRLAHYDQWTPATITERQFAFAAWALQRWSVAPPSVTELNEDIEIEAEDESSVDSDMIV
jgi:hypothetical protein